MKDKTDCKLNMGITEEPGPRTDGGLNFLEESGGTRQVGLSVVLTHWSAFGIFSARRGRHELRGVVHVLPWL